MQVAHVLVLRSGQTESRARRLYSGIMPELGKQWLVENHDRGRARTIYRSAVGSSQTGTSMEASAQRLDDLSQIVGILLDDLQNLRRAGRLGLDCTFIG
ncbi:hypothetical protein UP06_14125 [Bradyrhizobium sp. LTSP857]|nr:hypothetical protein UP06_14125 [Bradyrhizobium sp. LTSP857]